MAMSNERGECQVRCATWRGEDTIAEVGEFRIFPRRGRHASCGLWPDAGLEVSRLVSIKARAIRGVA